MFPLVSTPLLTKVNKWASQRSPSASSQPIFFRAAMPAGLKGDYMNHWADRFLIFLCSFALVAILQVPFEENGKSSLDIIAVKIKR